MPLGTKTLMRLIQEASLYKKAGKIYLCRRHPLGA